ncbi:MAG: NAD(P)H-dependent oxidoreductase [Ferrovibrio sp.]|uniref:NAD(P)H-dependent oxidoreductase n=1 Tax=Ferrovibrio sp. TaxID=1917215 RepID=UPI00391953A1
MGKHILILLGHPDPSHDRLCRALADAYADGAQAAGHEVRCIDIATLDIPYLRSQSDFEHGSPPGTLIEAQAAIAWAEHLLVVFPLWLGDMPAMLKAFFEQVLRPGFAFAYRAKGFPEKRLTGRTAHVAITMGMPAFAYRWIFFAHALRLLKRNILSFVGVEPVNETLFGNVGGADDATRQAWLAQMREAGRKAA